MKWLWHYIVIMELEEYVTITCIVNPGVFTQLVITVPVFMVL